MNFKETKTRSLTKTIVWRLIAVTNSFLVLLISTSKEPLWNAVYMNLTGLFIFYFYERIWNKISWGKIID